MSTSSSVVAASAAAPAARRGGSYLLEHSHSTVTRGDSRPVRHFEVSACGCRSWFCGECCLQRGFRLYVELVPVLETFRAVMMLTFTIDPDLFESPRAAYEYVMDHRCLSRTLQDLHRWGYLHSRRFCYVIEFQRRTLQAHFHVLVDASFIPFEALLASWSKHRPPWAGPVQGKRPSFGTVLFSKKTFKGGPKHAAQYATKYLTKEPEEGFPAWVMEMGKDRRVRRFGASRGFWGRAPKPRRAAVGTRRPTSRTYAERVAECGTSLNVFEVGEKIDPRTGEVGPALRWQGRALVDASVLPGVGESTSARGTRRSVRARDLGEVLKAIERAAGAAVVWAHQGFGLIPGGAK